MPLLSPAWSELHQRSPCDGAMKQRNLAGGYGQLPAKNAESAVEPEHVYIYLLAVVPVGAVLRGISRV